MRTLTLCLLALASTSAWAFPTTTTVPCPPGTPPNQCSGGIVIKVEPDIDDGIHDGDWAWAFETLGDFSVETATYAGGRTTLFNTSVAVGLIQDEVLAPGQLGMLFGGYGDLNRDGFADELLFGVLHLDRSRGGSVLRLDAQLDRDADGRFDTTVSLIGFAPGYATLDAETAWTLSDIGWSQEFKGALQPGDTFTTGAFRDQELGGVKYLPGTF